MYIKYNEGQKHAPKNAEVSESLDVFEDAGYVLEDNDLIVDIDNIPRETIEAIIRVFNIQTHTVWTTRGAHFYFKKPEGFRGAKGMVPLGIEVEYKHKTNTKSITVKLNGEARQVDNQNIREELPVIFQKGKYQELFGLSEGDGRNQKLFTHRKQINSLPDWQNIVNFINDYIFAEPLPDKELKDISRDMEVIATKDGESLIADVIMREKRVVKYSGALYYFDGEEYTADRELLYRMVYRYCEGQKTRYVEEVISQMEKRSKLIDPEQEFDIKLKNGLLKDGAFYEIDYTDFTPYSIPIEYDPEAEVVEDVDNYINQLTDNDNDYRELLMEILGHTLITNKEFKRILAKFFIFIGDGGNGKGTLLTIIQSILNHKNCSTLSIKNMQDERYMISLKGKLANLGDDIQDEPINNEQMKMLKNISTSDRIEMRKLYESAQSVSLSTTLIFTSNHILKSFEKGTSYKRRVMWLPMYTKPKKKDPMCINNLTRPEALKYWLKLIIEGYFRLYENSSFTDSEIVNDFNTSYHEENNTALGYIEELDEDEIIGKRNPELYEPYENWCEENGVTAQSVKQFKTTIEEVFDLQIKPRKINGKTQRVYGQRD